MAAFEKWQAHELIWIAAAISLPYHERLAAYRDITDMSGRTLDAVRGEAYRLLCGEAAQRAKYERRRDENRKMKAAAAEFHAREQR